ncbi:MAG: hypothetical protein IIZ59_03220 [Clostridia bacterium]|nr:hypothetical protein [Clostridia bacterium]
MAAEVMYNGVSTPISDLTDEQKQELRETNKRVVERARVYLQSFNKGVNPLDGTPVPDGELLKYPRIVKMFGYIDSFFGRCIEINGFGVKKVYAHATPDIPNEQEVLESTAKIIRAVSEGINPFEGNRPAGENEIVRNDKVGAFLQYTAAILENCGVDKLPCSLTDEDLQNFEYSETPLKITEIKNRLDALVDLSIYSGVGRNKITAYLNSIGMLEMRGNSNVPTQLGEQMGIHRLTDDAGLFKGVVYDIRGQQLVVRNIPTILQKDKAEENNSAAAED